LVLLPRGVGEVVDTAIGLYRRHWKLLMGTAAAVVVPIELVNAFLNRGTFSQLGNAFRSLQTPLAPSAPGIGSLAGLLTLLALPFLTGAVITAAAGSYMGTPPTVRQAWRRTLRRFWPVLGLGVLRLLIIGFAFLFFVVPGVFLYIRLVVAPEALLIEGAGPVTAMERSWRLTGGQWWRTFGALTLAAMLHYFAAFLIEAPTLALSRVTGPVGWLFVGLGGGIGQIVVAPFAIVVTVVVYFDLRIRKEAFDLAVAAQRLQARQPV
jgi:hypothetical protein